MTAEARWQHLRITSSVVRITVMDIVTAWVCCWPYGSLETANRKWYPRDKNTWEANNM